MARIDQDNLIVAHLSLIAPIAARIARRLPPSFECGDLAQYGAIGLLAAAREFEPSRQVPFAAYARMRIRAAILDAVRAGYRAATYEPLESAGCALPASQERVALASAEAQVLLRAVDRLSARQRAIVRLRYVEGVSQAAAGRALGISARGACYLEARALGALRRAMLAKGSPPFVKTNFE